MIWGRFIIVVAYFVVQNAYFGWHQTPQSDAELLADGIVLLLVALSVRSGGQGAAP